MKYTTGTGQVLSGVHSEAACSGRACVVHNPSDHVMSEFPTHWREDRGFMERVCPHGIGHPDPDDIYADPIHGCDGCCADERKTEMNNDYIVSEEAVKNIHDVMLGYAHRALQDDEYENDGLDFDTCVERMAVIRQTLLTVGLPTPLGDTIEEMLLSASLNS